MLFQNYKKFPNLNYGKQTSTSPSDCSIISWLLESDNSQVSDDLEASSLISVTAYNIEYPNTSIIDPVDDCHHPHVAITTIFDTFVDNYLIYKLTIFSNLYMPSKNRPVPRISSEEMKN